MTHCDTSSKILDHKSTRFFCTREHTGHSSESLERCSEWSNKNDSTHFYIWSCSDCSTGSYSCFATSYRSARLAPTYIQTSQLIISWWRLYLAAGTCGNGRGCNRRCSCLSTRTQSSIQAFCACSPIWQEHRCFVSNGRSYILVVGFRVLV